MIPKYIIVFIIFLGILLISIKLAQESVQKPKTQIIYRYLPRTFEEEQEEPVYVSDIFRTMFTQQSPWVASANEFDVRKSEAVNKYFVSQY